MDAVNKASTSPSSPSAADARKSPVRQSEEVAEVDLNTTPVSFAKAGKSCRDEKELTTKIDMVTELSASPTATADERAAVVCTNKAATGSRSEESICATTVTEKMKVDEYCKDVHKAHELLIKVVSPKGGSVWQQAKADPNTHGNEPAVNAEEEKPGNKTRTPSPPQLEDTCGTAVKLQGTEASSDIPENILSPPKSETQTDETNTATSSTCASSPASNAEMSPTGTNTAPATPTEETLPQINASGTEVIAGGGRKMQAINVLANGSIPKSGKPLMSALNQKLCKTPARSPRTRKPKGLVAMYESEIRANKIGIKLCIKKSDAASVVVVAASHSAVTNTTQAIMPSSTAALAVTVASPTTVNKSQQRKRSRKAKQRSRLDSDDSEYETKKKRTPINSAEPRQKKVSFSGVDVEAIKEPIEQTAWGARLPDELLFEIFQLVVDREGCLPTLFRLGRVCSLWRRVSLTPSLWRSMDLSTWIKEKYRTEVRLKWFIDNRCSGCTDLNLSNWKVSDINCVLGKLSGGCPKLAAITLAGWKGLTSDHLSFLVDNMKKLSRLDLSFVNVEMNASKSAVGLQSLCNALQTMNGRLTHLYLAHNRLAGIPQIVTILASHCPNLLLLDLSNVTTQATSHGILHIEKLQAGCGKLKVLRVTNSHMTLGAASMQEMMDSTGFPDLEELSVAALIDESRLVGDEHLQRILKTSSKLKLLDIRGCSRLTHESLIRLPAWDIKHLFLSGCSVTRDVGSGLELIASKWAHSLIELDLAWANVQAPLDNALRALAEKGSDSPLAHLNLCGSSVSDDAVKDILVNCIHMSSINLSSCRGLPRGIKRLMQGPQELQELREVLKVQLNVQQTSTENAGGRVDGTSNTFRESSSNRDN